MSKKLIIINSPFISGAELSLVDIIRFINKDNSFVITQTTKSKFIDKEFSNKTYYLPYKWFYKTLNPFRVSQYIFSMLVVTYKLCCLIRKEDVQVIYSNNYKAVIYGILAKTLTKKKLVCHIRDNINSSFIKKTLINKCDAVISISEFIFGQFPGSFRNNHLVYGGIDVEYWKKKMQIKQEILPKINPNHNLIACIGQLTKWKNQTDFIYVAKLILKKKHNTQFLIIGDDLSGREIKYKEKLYRLVNEFGLKDKVHFLGYREDILDLINCIDVLVHTAINEPFGRVLVEAMALEKPVTAYECGGPAEIILDGKTGYLTEPKNYIQLAAKTMTLIENIDLRTKMGKAGRKRVVEKFNVNRQVKELDEIFSCL